MILKVSKVWLLSALLAVSLHAEDVVVKTEKDADAKDAPPAAQQMAEKTEKIEVSRKVEEKCERYAENVFEISFSSANLFSPMHESSYYFAPQMLTVGWQLDNVGNEGWRRGNTEFLFSGFYSPIYHGNENHMIGSCWGPQYNFVQPGWKFVPYVNSRVGFLFIDSVDNNIYDGAQGQDYCFTFFIGVGCRYDVDDHWSLALEGMYQHISNGGLSEPTFRNCGLESIGPNVSLIYKF